MTDRRDRLEYKDRQICRQTVRKWENRDGMMGAERQRARKKSR